VGAPLSLSNTDTSLSCFQEVYVREIVSSQNCPQCTLAHQIERVFEVNVDAEYAALQALRLTRDPVELELVEINSSSFSSTVLAQIDEVSASVITVRR
jgi:hypothetical protein